MCRLQRRILLGNRRYCYPLTITDFASRYDPGNAEWQRDLMVSLLKLSEVTSDKATAMRALEVMLAMQARGILASRDARMIEEFKRRAGL